MKKWAVSVAKVKDIHLRDGLLYSGYLLLAAGLVVDALKCAFVRSDILVDACEREMKKSEE